MSKDPRAELYTSVRVDKAVLADVRAANESMGFDLTLTESMTIAMKLYIRWAAAVGAATRDTATTIVAEAAATPINELKQQLKQQGENNDWDSTKAD